MGFYADSVARAAPAADSIADDPSILGEASKGLSRGLRDTGASALQGLGMGAEYFGRNDVASTLRGGAQSLRDSAAQPQFAPESADFEHAHGVGQTLRWVGSKVGEMAPMVGAGAVGGLVGGLPGAAATMVPGQFGAIDQEQQANPQLAAQPIDTRVGHAALPALASSALMTLPVGSLIGKLGLPASRSALGALASNVGQGAVTGGVGMGGADALVQHGVDPDAPTDWNRAGEAALGGAVAVGGMHALHAVPSYVKGQSGALADTVGKGFTSINERLRAAKAAAVEGVDAAVESAPAKKVSSVYDDMTNMVGNAAQSVSDYASRIAKGMPVGVDDATLAKMTPEQVDATMKQSEPAEKKWTSDTIDALWDKVPPEKQKILSDAKNNLDDYTERAKVAAVDLGQKAVESTRNAVSDALAWSKKKLGISDDPALQKSEDYTGTEKAIVQGLGDSGLLARRPELVENDRDRMQLGAALRNWFVQMAKGPVDPTTVEHIKSILGDDATPVMNSVKKAMNDTLQPGEATQFFTNVKAIQDAQKEGGNVQSGLNALLQPQHQSADAAYKKQMADTFVSHARGEHMNGPEAQGMDAAGLKALDAAANTTMDTNYQHMFGSNADAARALVEKAAKVNHGDEHTGSTDYTDDGQEIKQPRDKVPRGQGPAFDEAGNRLEPEALDEMRFGLTAADKAGNMKMRRNGAPYLDPALEKAQGVEKAYATRHLEELKAKYPDKEVAWEPNEGSKDRGHIMVRDRANPEDINDETVDKMRLDTKRYSKSDSRMEFDTGAGKPLILDSMRVAREMGGRNPQGSAEPDLTYAHRLSRQFMDGVSALTSKFGAVPTIPEKAVIGHVGGEPFTWGMAQKMRKTTPEDLARDADARHLQAMKTEYDRATLSQQELAKKGLTQRNMPREDREALKEDIKKLAGDLDYAKNRELSSGDFADPRTNRALYAKRRGYMEQDPLEEKNTAYGRDGRLTQEGLRMMLEGDYHGGIEVGRSSSRAEEADRKGADARFDNPEFDRGTGQTEIGADAQVHTAFAGGKDDPFFGHNNEGARPQQPDNIVRSNQDGTPHWIDTRSGYREAAADMGNELLARTTAPARSLGAKLVALSKPEVMARMNDRAQQDLARASAGGLTNTERAKILNPLADHFLSEDPKAPPAMSKPRADGAAQPYGQDYAVLKGKDVTLKVPVADAEGNVKNADVTRDAKEYMHELDRRAEALEEVRKCLE